MPFGWDIYTVLLVLTVLVLALGVHRREYMRVKLYQGLCVIAFGYQAWFGLIYTQNLGWISDSVKWIFFILGVISVLCVLLKILRLSRKEEA